MGATIRAGVTQQNSALFWKVQFSAGDPLAFLEVPGGEGKVRTVCIVRDVELDRAREKVRADEVCVPADYEPESGFSADREVGMAQAAAECLRRHGVSTVTADRTLPLSFATVLGEAGIKVVCDLEMGVMERRRKSAWEIEKLRYSQEVTEGAIRLACEMIARAEADREGVLRQEGDELTSARVRAAVNLFLMERGFSGPSWIIAGGAQGASCHHTGEGALRTGEPVIVDIFPTDQGSHYCGDCTRTVVHGDVPEELVAMHAAVCEAKAAGTAAIRAGVTGKAVHAATTEVIRARGFGVVTPEENKAGMGAAMTHGTGHGIGLDVHEPPLLAPDGVELVAGDVLTVEPGLYRVGFGGVRVEDLVVVTEDGCENLNRLPEGMDWSG
ncbi:MAG: Xaa-Pro peptidase family protein [Verrucomicrobiota bacterium]